MRKVVVDAGRDPRNSLRKARIMRNITIAAIIVIALGLSGCDQVQSQPKTAAAPPPSVTIAKPVTRQIADHDEYVGRFVAVESVEVRARVSGYLEAIHFKDGQIVRKGDLLFVIDRRPFEISLAQAQAGLEEAHAALAFALADLQRAQGVAVGTVITQQTLDQRIQARRAAQAAVATREQAVRQAALDLEFTELRAPVDGRIGDRRVSVGNLVTGGAAGTTLLATIESIDPIRFEFTVDEGSYLRYARHSKDKVDAADRGLTIPARLKLIDESSFTHAGRLDFIDNTISRSTGTIRARAVFANRDRTFTPGMFARVQIAAAPPADALLVPEVAISAEQVRKFVMVVDAANVARSKYITLGPLIDGLRVVEGLAPDDNVIVNGLVRARPGAKVAPHRQNTADAAALARVD
jgi:RND family efflux transporter MFP subunit